MSGLTRWERVAALALAFSCAASGAAWVGPGLTELQRIAAIDVLWVAVSAAAAGAVLAASFRPDNAAARTSLRLLAAGLVAWALGQAGLTYDEVVHGTIPDVALTDIGFIGALLLFVAALCTWPRNRERTTGGDLVDGGLIVAAVLVASVAFVIAPIFEDGYAGPAQLVLLAYPLGDALLVGVGLTGLALRRLEQRGRLGVLALGFGMLVVADTNYALVDDYATGVSLLDTGWTLGFAAIGIAALLPPSWSPRHGPSAGLAPVIAIGLLAAVGVAQLLEELAHGDTTHAVVSTTVFGLLIALGLRHAISAGVRLRLQERLHAEHALRGAAFDASRTGLCVFDDAGRPHFHNRAWDELLGADAVTEPWLEAVTVLADRLATLDDQPPVRFWTAEGRYVELLGARLATGDRLVTVNDLTDEERERATRSRFLAEMVGAQDYEARRIAELLHDDVVQRLTALGLRLELHATRSGDETLAELAGEAGAATAAIRRLLVDLHPVVLESRGLGPAIEAAGESLRALGVAVRVEPFDARLAPEDEQLVYRLVQEAFANALKHAEADTVTVALRSEDGVLHGCVADDGRGLDERGVRTAVSRGSLGLHLARERLQLAGGALRVERGPERGTDFAFDLPLRAPAVEQPVPAEAVL